MPASKLAVDAGAGLYYNNRISFRRPLGPRGDIQREGRRLGQHGHRITPIITLGAEVGFDYITLSSSA